MTAGDLLSPGQQALWFAQRAEPTGRAYNVAFAIHVRSQVDPARLGRAVGDVTGRHAQLRSGFRLGADGAPRRVSNDELRLRVVDAHAMSDDDLDVAVRRSVDEPFILDNGDPAARVVLLRRSADDSVLVVVAHHIVTDFLSHGSIVAAILDRYRALDMPDAGTDPASEATYDDFVREELAGQGSDRQREFAYWRGAVAGVGRPVELPAIATPSPASGGGTVELELPAGLLSRLGRIARQEGTGSYALMLAAFSSLVYRHSGQERIAVVCPTVHPARRRYADVIGYFVDPLLIVSEVHGGEPFSAVMHRTQRTLDEAGRHARLKLAEVAQLIGAGSGPLSPVGQFGFGFQQASRSGPLLDMFACGERLGEISYAGLSVSAYDLPQQEGQFALAAEVVDGSRLSKVTFRYRSDVYSRAGVECLAQHFVRLLDSLADQTATPVDDLRLASPDEQATVDSWTFGDVVDTGPAGVLDHFAHFVDTQPDAVAIATPDGVLTFREVSRRADGLASVLRARGLRPGQFVGICLGRTPEEIIAILGVIRARGAFVPIDPRLPPSRISFIVDDCGMEMVVTTGALAARTGIEPSLVVDVIGADDGGGKTDSHPVLGPPESGNPVYVIYTSGSTGRPKGVVVQHEGLANLVHWQRDYFRLGAGDVVLRFASPGFDASVWEIFLAVCSGAAIYVSPPDAVLVGAELVRHVVAGGITHMTVPPSVLSGLAPASIPGVCVVVAGEACPPALTRTWSAGRDFVNAYGPTEATVCATVYRPEAHEQHVPIGRPLANLRTVVVNRALQPVAIGEPGELVIVGPSVAAGYHGLPELTEQSFRTASFGGRAYLTGDIVCWRPDGELLFIGRRDSQIKVRGYRVEPGEIESALLRHSGVDQAIVVAVGDGDARALHAFVTGTETGLRLRARLGQLMPDYMVPSVISVVAALPLTVNGKIDRSALIALDVPAAVETPGTDCEDAVAAIWAEVLGARRISRDDDFFTLGGHSLAAVRAVALMRERLGAEIPLSVMLNRPTVADLATLIGIGEPQASRPDAVADPDAALVPFPLTEIQHAYLIGRSDEVALSGVSAHGYFEILGDHLDPRRLSDAWNEVVARHPMLRTVVTDDRRQRVLADVPWFDIPVLDLRDADRDHADRSIAAVREEMSHQLLPVESWPTFDIRLSRLPAGSSRLHLSFDGFFLDATSMRKVLGEWARIYGGDLGESGRLASPSRATPTFRDYVMAMLRSRGDADEHRAQTYWRGRIPALPDRPDLPMASDPERLNVPRFTTLSHKLSRSQWTAVCAAASRWGVTPSVALLTAYAECLATWAKSRHFVLNITTFHRPPLHSEIDQTVGDFTSLTLLEVDLRKRASFIEDALAIQRQLWSDMDHQQFSGIKVLRERAKINGNSVVGAMPIVFTSTLGVGDGEARQQGWGFEAFGRLDYASSQTPQVWLDHVVVESADGIELIWNVVMDLFPEGMPTEMFQAYVSLVGVLADQDRWAGAVGDLRSEDAQSEQARANDTVRDFDVIPPLHGQFRAHALRCPDAIAVVDGDAQITYRQLASTANAVTLALRSRGVDTGNRIAVTMRRGWRQMAAVLGISQAGAVYVPISPEIPASRRAAMLTESGTIITLTDVDGVDIDGALVIDSLAPIGDAEATADARSVAYIIYTSGSTGRPKGVTVTHRSAMNSIMDINRMFGVGPADRIIAVSDLGFDLSVYDIFGLLGAGGTVVIPAADLYADPEHLAALIETHGITLWDSVPAIMQLVIEYAERKPEVDLGSLRTVMLSGDWIPTSLPDRIRARCARAEVTSLGGATEAAIWSIYHQAVLPDASWPSIPYGRPMANQTFHVLGDRMEFKPTWSIGELYIGGAGLAEGYWADEGRTAERFVVHPDTGDRLYRTGDLGRYRPDGVIEFLGRADHQVKINGYRVELGDIEAALVSHPAINEAAVVVSQSEGGRSLAAFVTADASAGGYFTGAESPPWSATARKRSRTALEDGSLVMESTGDLRRFAEFEQLMEAQSTAVIRTTLRAMGLFRAAGERQSVGDVMAAGSIHRRYRRLLTKWLLTLADDGLLRAHGDLFECVVPLVGEDLEVGWAAAGAAARAWSSGPTLLNYFRTSSEKIIPLLRSVEDPLELLFEGGGFEIADALYRDNPVLRRCNAIAAAAVSAFGAAADRPLRVMELGAGTGGSTESILAALSGRCAEYTFTDLSSYLIDRAKQRFGDLPFLRYARYDINLPPGAHGRRSHEYDLVIAANVMHDAVKLADALGYAADLLAPGGMLVMIEGVGANRVQLISLGLLEGLSAYQDERTSVHDALLSVEEWHGALLASGFTDVCHRRAGGNDLEALDQVVLLAAGPNQTKSLDTAAVRRDLADAVPSYMVPTSIVALSALPLTANGKVDRNTLATATRTAGAYATHQGPDGEAPTGIEDSVVSAWIEALEMRTVGRHDDFFELGGDSLSAIRIVTQIRESLQIPLRVQDLFECRTVARLAAVIEDRVDSDRC